MRPSPLVPLALLLMAALAGCTEAPAETIEEDPGPVVHTSPDDPGDLGADGRDRSHLHDYWNGQDELPIFDETFTTSCVCGTGAPFFRFEPPMDAVFPLGTRWVNVTVEWNSDEASLYGDATLWVETAADHVPHEVGPIENGETITIEVTNNTQNDLPHERLSNWAFEVRVEAPSEVGLWRNEGEARIAATAARGLDIPLFPPHPDLWNGTTEILLFEDSDAAEPLYHGGPSGGQAGSNWLGPHVPDDGRVVPYDMGHVVVEVTYGQDAPLPFTLVFHDAMSRDWRALEPAETQGDTVRYVITPDQGFPDGPYVQQSSWIFEIETPEDRPAFVGSYSIRATVFADPPA